MLPTPAKLHYQFTMHDLSKVFQGLLLASREGMMAGSGGGGGGGGSNNNSNSSSSSSSLLAPVPYLAALWAHECERVFCDRMVSTEDASWVRGAIAEIAARHFGRETAEAARLFASGSSSASSSDSTSSSCSLAALPFVDFLRDAEPDPETGELPTNRPSVYELVPPPSAVAKGGEEKGEEATNSSSSSSSLLLLR